MRSQGVKIDSSDRGEREAGLGETLHEYGMNNARGWRRSEGFGEPVTDVECSGTCPHFLHC
jgi:hypothetical protein